MRGQLQLKPKLKMSTTRWVVFATGFVTLLIMGLVLFFSLAKVPSVQAALSGSHNPTSASNVGGGNYSWQGPSGCYYSDNTFTYSGIYAGYTTQYLMATGFGFSIPQGATINGITVKIEHYAGHNKFLDYSVMLTKDGSNLVGSNYASGTHWSDKVEETFSYGGGTDLWGTTWTDSEINDSTFGVAISVYNSHSHKFEYAYIDNISVSVEYTVSATEGPGGITSGLALWLDAGEGVTGTGQVSAWADQSGQANHAVMDTSSYQPQLQTNYLNFNNVIDFDGSSQYLQGEGGGYTNDIFVVLVPDDKVNRSLAGQNPVSFDAKNADVDYAILSLGSYTNGLTDEVIHYGVGQTYGWKEAYTSSTASFAAGRPMIINITNDDNQSSSALFVSQTEVGNANYGSYVNAEDDVQYRLGGNMHYSGGYYFDGKIAEFITYSDDLGATDRSKVTSYLGIKYGVTIDGNYMLSSGTTIWNKTDNADYHYNVAGIARDDKSRLNQRISKSQSSFAVFTAFKDAAFGNDQDALLWGNDQGDLLHGQSNGSSNYSSALKRTWKVELNGNPGLVSIQFDLSFIDHTMGKAGDYALLIDADGDFTSGATEHVTGSYLDGTTLHFADVRFTDGYYFTLGLDESGSSALPVEFAYFNASAVGQKVNLTWGTAMEENNEMFQIERSSDGIDWERVAEVDGAGNSILPMHYQEVDDHPNPGVSYYRIRQVDYSGLSECSPVRRVIIEGDESTKLNITAIYPNPVQNQVSLEFVSPKPGAATLEVMSSSGTVFRREKVEVETGTNTIHRDLDFLKSGSYLVRITIGEESQTKRLIKT